MKSCETRSGNVPSLTADLGINVKPPPCKTISQYTFTILLSIEISYTPLADVGDLERISLQDFGGIGLFLGVCSISFMKLVNKHKTDLPLQHVTRRD